MELGKYDFLPKIITFPQLAKLFKHVGVQELNFSRRCPIITNVIVPKEDEYGLWMELWFEFDGEISAKVRTLGMRIDASQ